jgi:hypothetical protein
VAEATTTTIMVAMAMAMMAALAAFLHVAHFLT